MNAWVWLAIHDVTGFAAAVYLVTHDYPWWAAACLLMVAGSSVGSSRKSKERVESAGHEGTP